MQKMNVVVLFGGQSSEHEISRKSAKTVLAHIDSDKYNVYPVGITKEGQWLSYQGDFSQITDPEWMKQSVKAMLSPDAVEKSLYIFGQELIQVQVDVVFPVLHGLFGEDGSIQGLLELAKLPYVGCGVLASAVSMDKLYTKIIVERLGIRQARYIAAYKEDYNLEAIHDEILKRLKYPVFIKPSNAGSSIGVSKAKDLNELESGLSEAFAHDRKILIEEMIVGREVECAILGNLTPRASDVGEILSAEDYYDFDAKYNNAESKTVVPAPMSDDIRKEIRENAVSIFKAVDGRGLSRVDFFIEKGTDQVVFNEINTLPGFTDISMYPMLWENKGVSKHELIDKLIRLAIQKV